MADDGMLGLHWGGYYRAPPLTGNLGLQLMPSVGERNTKPFFSDGGSGGYPPRECGVADPEPMPISFARGIWYHSNRDSCKMLNVFQGNHHHQSHSYGAFLPEAAGASDAVAASGMHTLQMMQQVEPLREESMPEIEGPGASQHDASTSKKRSKGQQRPSKASKPKKAKKTSTPRDDSSNPFGKGKSVNKTMDMVINGIDLDLSGIPTPVCTCTGRAQQCYRWGAGGWQSACCTTTISVYPLPMSTKRRGARIAGRKMSQGAFKKVLEKLAGEGQDFSSPIDLKLFWAKHGTNKFVTIR